jgi:hypothetical protein
MTALVTFAPGEGVAHLRARIAEQLTPAYYCNADPYEAAELLCAQLEPEVWENMTSAAKGVAEDQLVPGFFRKLGHRQLELLRERMLVPSIWKTLDPASQLYAEGLDEMILDGKLAEAERNGLATAVGAIRSATTLSDVFDSRAQVRAFRKNAANLRWNAPGSFRCTHARRGVPKGTD